MHIGGGNTAITELHEFDIVQDCRLGPCQAGRRSRDGMGHRNSGRGACHGVARRSTGKHADVLCSSATVDKVVAATAVYHVIARSAEKHVSPAPAFDPLDVTGELEDRQASGIQHKFTNGSGQIVAGRGAIIGEVDGVRAGTGPVNQTSVEIHTHRARFRAER